MPAPVPPPPPSAPRVDPEMLGRLAELLVRAADHRSGPPVVVHLRDVDGHSVELGLASVDSGDLHASLAGTTAPPELDGLGCLVTGRARSFDDARDHVTVGEVLGRAVTALVVWRDGTAASCLRIDDREPRVQIDRPGDDGGGACAGRLVDVVRRCLGLPTAPPAASPSELVVDVWLHRVHAMALDGTPVDHHTVDALVPPLPATWEACREQCAEGVWPELAIDAALAEWMDVGMFAREALAGFPDPAELLLDLADLLAPDVWEHLVGVLVACTRTDGEPRRHRRQIPRR